MENKTLHEEYASSTEHKRKGNCHSVGQREIYGIIYGVKQRSEICL